MQYSAIFHRLNPIMEDKNNKKHFIELSIEGLHSDDKHVRFPEFISRLQFLNSALGRIDLMVSDGKKATYFRVVGLSHSSPSTITLEAVMNEGMPDTRQLIINEFTTSLRAVEKNEIPEDIDYAYLNEIKELVKPLGKDIESMVITANEESIHLTQNFAISIEKYFTEEEKCFGSIEGALEQINIHSGINIFHVYPSVGPTKIKCHFGSKLINIAKQAVGSQVSVSGLMTYKPKDNFPSFMNVDKMEVFPDVDELPTLKDLFNKAPNLTAGLLSEEFIKIKRNDWD